MVHSSYFSLPWLQRFAANLWSKNRDSSSETQAFDLYIQIDGNDGYWTILTSRSEYIKAANGKQLKAKIVFNRPNSNEAIKRPCDNPFYLPMTSGTGNFYISVKPPSKTAVHYVDTSKICLYESHTEASMTTAKIFFNI